MVKRPALARSELEVAQVFWRLGNATVRRAFEAMPSERGIPSLAVPTRIEPSTSFDTVVRAEWRK